MNTRRSMIFACLWALFTFPAFSNVQTPPVVNSLTDAQVRSNWSKVPLKQLRQAAEAGKPDAQYYLGMIEWEAAARDEDMATRQWFINGTNRPPPLPRGEVEAARAKWTARPEPYARKAAKGGDRSAQVFVTGLDAAQAVERGRHAFEWLERAAKQAFPLAEYEVGIRYLGRVGWGIVPPDAKTALSWLRRAANDGVEGGQHWLGMLLIQGEFVAPDLAQGIDWLRSAAAQGNARAEFELAQQYACGNGDPRNSDETPLALLTKSAKAGWAEAAFALGERYRLGLGVAEERARAYFWYDLAAREGSQRGWELSSQLRPSLTPKEIQQAAGWLTELIKPTPLNSEGRSFR